MALATLSFTPRSSGKLLVIVDCRMTITGGSDWGTAYTSRVFCTQNGVTTYGNNKNAASGAWMCQGIFDVVAGLQVDCGLNVDCTGTTTITAQNITITASLEIQS